MKVKIIHITQDFMKWTFDREPDAEGMQRDYARDGTSHGENYNTDNLLAENSQQLSIVRTIVGNGARLWSLIFNNVKDCLNPNYSERLECFCNR